MGTNVYYYDIRVKARNTKKIHQANSVIEPTSWRDHLPKKYFISIKDGMVAVKHLFLGRWQGLS
jgi:hypothetical protein